MRVFLSLLGKKNWELLTQLNKINSKSNGKLIASVTEKCLEQANNSSYCKNLPPWSAIKVYFQELCQRKIKKRL